MNIPLLIVILYVLLLFSISIYVSCLLYTSDAADD